MVDIHLDMKSNTLNNKFIVLSRQLPDSSSGDPFSLLANCFLFFCRKLAVFIFPTLLADLKDPIQNWKKDPSLWAELHTAHAPNILSL